MGEHVITYRLVPEGGRARELVLAFDADSFAPIDPAPTTRAHLAAPHLMKLSAIPSA